MIHKMTQTFKGHAWPRFSGDYVPVLQDPTVQGIAKAKNKTTAQVLLRYHLQRGLAAVPKSVKPERVIENFQVSSDDV